MFKIFNVIHWYNLSNKYSILIWIISFGVGVGSCSAEDIHLRRNKDLANSSQLYAIPNFPSKVKIATFADKCLDVPDGSMANGAGLIQWDCHGGWNQQFTLENLGDNKFNIKNDYSKKCLDTFEGSVANGARLIQWDCHGGTNQQFTPIHLGDNKFTIKPVHSGKCLDVPDGSQNNGDSIIQWDCHGGYNQGFSILGTPDDTTVDPSIWFKANHTVMVDGSRTIIIPKMEPSPGKRLVTSLTILVDFQDMPSSISPETVAISLNKDLRDFSIKKANIDLRHVIISTFRSSRPYSYFMDPTFPEKENEYIRSHQLVEELYGKLNEVNFDFSTLTLHNSWGGPAVHSFVVLFAADKNSGRAGWAKGLWPVTSWLQGNVRGAHFSHYQISAIVNNTDLQMGTIVHEAGHQVLGLGEEQGDWDWSKR